MTYEQAVAYIETYGEELSFDEKERLECLVFIAPTDPNHFYEFSRSYISNNYNPDVILPYVEEDVCVVRVGKRYLEQGVFAYRIIAE